MGAVIASLVALAVPAYQGYVERAQLAQLLMQVDQISTATRIELASGERRIDTDAKPGKAPPRLQTVPDSAFNEAGGLRLQLIRAPAGFFASSPQSPRYGLVADLTGTANERRLRLLAGVLPFDAGDKVWIARDKLAFPLVNRPAPGTPAGPPPGTGWEGGGTAQPDGTWTCQGTVSVHGTDGKPLTDVQAGVQIKVTMSVTTWNGQLIERGWTDQGNLNGGKATFSYGGLSAQQSKGELVTGCRLDVLKVVYYYPPNPAIPWDGKTPQAQIPMPGGPAQAAGAQGTR